ncbi:MAG: hypothetical protein ACRELY_27525 [Polyangiaceae bacterium]
MRWERGGEASIVTLKGDAITVRSTVPAPPGARIKGQLDLTEAKELLMKVHGAKKQPDGSFVIEGRCIDMTRDLRLSIEAALEK